MLKSILNFTALIGFFRAYKGKIYLIFSLIVLYFLIDYVYQDIQLYLSENNKDYLIYALWVKSSLLVLLSIILLISFRPQNKKIKPNIIHQSHASLKCGTNDEGIIEKVRSKKHLARDETLDCEEEISKPHSPEDDLKIIESIRDKKRLESREDKIFRVLKD